MSKVPSVIDLFAGGGGLSLGFAAAGFIGVAAIDCDQSAVDTLRDNQVISPPVIIKRDIRRFGPKAMARRLENLPKNLRRPSVIAAGPPCQGWSRVGRGKLKSLGRLDPSWSPMRDPRNRLYRSFLGYVSYFKPEACLMENVCGMATYFGRDMAAEISSEIAELGYEVKVAEIEADRLGVPQRRKRLVFVGLRDDLGMRFTFPETPPEDLKPMSRCQTVKDAIKDLPRISAGQSRETIRYRLPESRSAYLRAVRPAWMDGCLTAHIARWHRREDIESFRSMAQGATYLDVPARLRRYRTDIFHDKYRRLVWNEPSPCLTAHLSKDCYSHIHPSQSRTISVREAARLQGFPDWYVIKGSMGDRFRLIGNSVPPLAAYALASRLYMILDGDGKGKSSWRELSNTARGIV